MAEKKKPVKEEPKDGEPKVDELEQHSREWTLMFFFGGDNELSPSMVSELKAIKDAGFQLNTSVLAFFDPNEIGAPTQIYDVNEAAKMYAPASIIGDDKDSRVHSLNEDSVDADMIDATAGEKSAILKDRLKEPDTLDVKEALELFLGFCQESYPAKHYVLFLVGHGMIVGNDAFLPDDHVIVKKAPKVLRSKVVAENDNDSGRPITALSLKQLEEVVREFSDNVKDQDGQFELLALHSCSMSAVEVVYQLKGTANYMMATEGVSFVGSWPYRKLLKTTFNAIEETLTLDAGVDVRALVSKLYFLSLHNGTDFLSAGYSSDLALCSLQAEAVNALTEPLQRLVVALKHGLEAGSKKLDPTKERDERVKELILLAHWKAQSYWQENYTDLFDFCLCLGKSCDPNDELQKTISAACKAVMEKISETVVHSDHYGSKYQYSHGLSIYFPWSRPVEDEANGILQRYEQEYVFTAELGTKYSSWLSFLNMYFDETQRDRRAKEEEDSESGTEEGGAVVQQAGVTQELPPAFKAARAFASPFGSLSRVKPSPELSGVKPSPEVGAPCSCPSIKNYPEEKEIEIKFQGRKKCNVKAFSISKDALAPFEPK